MGFECGYHGWWFMYKAAMFILASAAFSIIFWVTYLKIGVEGQERLKKNKRWKWFK